LQTGGRPKRKNTLADPDVRLGGHGFRHSAKESRERQWRKSWKSWGTGRDCPLQSFDWGDSSVDCPPKFKLRRYMYTAGSCFV